MPVGRIWEFDLEQREKHAFGVKWNFKLGMSCSTFSRQLKVSGNKIRRTDLQSGGQKKCPLSGQKKQRKIASRNFHYLIRTRRELPYSWQKAESDCEWRGSRLDGTRVNLRWKGGQLKLPNAPDQKLVS